MGICRRSTLTAAVLMAVGGSAAVASPQRADADENDTATSPRRAAAESDAMLDINLHQAADRIGLLTGSMVNWGILHLAAQAERAVYIGNTISPVDLSWGEARPARGQFAFDHSDWIHDWARTNGLGVHQSGALAARNLFNPE